MAAARQPLLLHAPLLLLLLLLLRSAPPAVAVTNVLTKTACESYSLEIRCEPEETIAIVHANYGRTSSMTCKHANDVHRNCMAEDAVSAVAERCNGRGSCSIQASNVIFGDPCPGTAKYLFVQYYCQEVPGPRERLARRTPLPLLPPLPLRH